MTKQLAFPVIDNLATGRNIELLRKQNEMSVRELQEIFGFTSPQSIYKWQWGETIPDIANLMMLSDLWNVSLEDILVRQNKDVF